MINTVYKGKTQKWLRSEAMKALEEFTKDAFNNRQRGPNLEVVTLILDELRNRKKNTLKSQKIILDKLEEKGHKEIDWLIPISYLLRGLKKKSSGHFQVYLIRMNKNGEYGVYIGQTGADNKTVKDRFREHIDANNFLSRPQVQKFGEEILSFPVIHLQNTSQEEAEELESKIRVLLLNSSFLPNASLVKGGKNKK